MKRKLISILLSAVMIVTFMPAMAWAIGDATVETGVAKIGSEYYSTLDKAVSEAAENATITLCSNLDNVGNVSLPAGVTLDGDNHQITGDSAIYINAASGGTVKNVKFKNIHDANNKKSAIYGEYLADTMTVENCSFEQWDWDAIQIVPEEDAKIVIKNNYFSKGEDINSRCCVHVQADSSTKPVIDATITGNVFITNNLVAAAAIWYASNESEINLSNNYFDALHLNVALYDGDNLVTDKCDNAFPCKERADSENATLTPAYKRPYAYGVEYYRNSEEAVKADNVAAIDSIVYETLAAAVTAAKSGETITMLADVQLDNSIIIDKDIKLDLNGKKITVVDDNWKGNKPTAEGIFYVKSGGKLTVDDNGGGGAIDSSMNTSVYGAVIMTIKGQNDESLNAELEINGGTLKGYYYGIATNGTRHNTKITVNGGAITGEDEAEATSIYHPNKGSLTINGGILTGYDGIAVKGGTPITITGGEFIATGTKNTPTAAGTSGCNSVGSALYVEGNYGYGAVVTVTGGKFNTYDSSAPTVLSLFNEEAESTIVLCGGMYSNKPDEDYIAEGCAAAAITDSAYKYIVGLGAKSTNGKLTAGSFTIDPSEYVDSDYRVRLTSDKEYPYEVVPASDSTPTPTPAPQPEPQPTPQPIVVDGGTSVDVSKDVEIKKDESGAVVAKTEISESVVQDIVETATKNASETVVISAVVAPTGAQTDEISKTEVSVPVDIFEKITKIESVENVVIQTNIAEITLDKETAKEISAQSPDGATITVEAVRQDEESKKVAQDVYELKIIATSSSGSVIISDFKGGKVTVKVATPEGLTGKKVACLYRSDKGILTRRSITKQDDLNGFFSFTTNHFSDYIVTEESVAQKMLVNQTAITQKAAKAVGGSKIKLTIKRATWDKELGKKTKTYQIYRSTKKNSGFKKIRTLTNKKATVTYSNGKLKKGQTYYYKVRAKVKLSNGKYAYTKWSKVQKVKVK